MFFCVPPPVSAPPPPLYDFDTGPGERTPADTCWTKKRWLSTVTWQTSAGVSAVNKDILAQVRTYHVLWRLLSLIPAPAGRPASLVPFEEISPHTARRWLQQLDSPRPSRQEKNAQLAAQLVAQLAADAASAPLERGQAALASAFALCLRAEVFFFRLKSSPSQPTPMAPGRSRTQCDADGMEWSWRTLTGRWAIASWLDFILRN